MEKTAYLPGEILSLAAGAAERLLKAGSGDAALLYLYLLTRNGICQTEDAVRVLRWDKPRLASAHSLLVGMGLAAEEKRSEPAVPLREAPPEYTAEDISQELKDPISPFPALVAEVQRRLGKVLSTNDLKCLYTIYDYTGLPVEVILLTVNWAVREYQDKYGPGRMPKLPQIQREAIRWKEQGIDTVEVADEHIRHLTELRERTVRVLALMDIRGRAPIAREREYIKAWTELGFPDDALRLAYEKTVLKTGSLNWRYMDGILKSWHRQGTHTLKEIENAERPHPSRSSVSAKMVPPQPGKPGEAEQRVRGDLERMREFLKKQGDI